LFYLGYSRDKAEIIIEIPDLVGHGKDWRMGK